MTWHLFQTAVLALLVLMVSALIASAVLASRAGARFNLLECLQPFSFYGWLDRVIEKARANPVRKADLRLARLTRFLMTAMYVCFAVTVLLMVIVVA